MRTVTDLDMLITVEQLEDSPAALSLGNVCGNIGIFLDTFLTLTMFYRESYLESYLELLSTQVPDDANAASGDRLPKASGDQEQDFPDWPCKNLWSTDALSSNFHKRQTIQLKSPHMSKHFIEKQDVNERPKKPNPDAARRLREICHNDSEDEEFDNVICKLRKRRWQWIGNGTQ